MRRLIITLGALLVAALTIADVQAAGQPLMKGLTGPAELAGLIETSLSQDPSGNSRIDSGRCQRDGSCATPYMYYYGIASEHPSAGLRSITELPRYLRSLVKKPAPSGVWQMSRLLDGRYDAVGWQRVFHQGEGAWVDVNTAEPILAEDCGNVVGRSVGQAVVTRQTVPAQPVAGGCPEVYTLKINVWQPPAFNMPGVEDTHRVEELRVPFLNGPHVSRDRVRHFRSAYSARQLARNAAPQQFRVSLIMTPEAQGGAPQIVREEHYADITVLPGRFYELQFPRVLLEQWDAIRTVPLGGKYVSPPRSHLTGFQEIRFFNHTPSRPRLGEWENNPVPDCVMNQHFIE